MAQKTISQLPLITTILDPNTTFMAVDGLTDTNAISVANFNEQFALPPYLQGVPEDFDDNETSETLTGSQSYDVSNLVKNRRVLILNNVEGGGGMVVTLTKGTIPYDEPFYLDTFIRMRAFTGSEVLIRDESARILATCYIANASANTHIDNGFSLKGNYVFKLNSQTNQPTFKSMI